MRQRGPAEIAKLKAETDKTKAEADKIRAELQTSVTATAEDLKQEMESLLLEELDVRKLEQRLNSAQEISMVATSSYVLLNQISDTLSDLVRRGGRARCLYVKPDGHAIEMVAMRSVGVEKSLEHLRRQYHQTIEIWRNIARETTERGNVQIKVIDYLNSGVITIVDQSSEQGRIYLALNGFGQHFLARPGFVVSPQRQPKLFAFFRETFENAWHTPESNTILP